VVGEGMGEQAAGMGRADAQEAPKELLYMGKTTPHEGLEPPTHSLGRSRSIRSVDRSDSCLYSRPCPRKLELRRRLFGYPRDHLVERTKLIFTPVFDTATVTSSDGRCL
jgi:hypothetical protein